MVRKVREIYCFIYIKKDKLWLLYISVSRLLKSDVYMLIRNLCFNVIDLLYWNIGYKFCIIVEVCYVECGGGGIGLIDGEICYFCYFDISGILLRFVYC